MIYWLRNNVTADSEHAFLFVTSVKPDAVLFTSEHTDDEVTLKVFDQSTIFPTAKLPFAIDQLPKVFTASRQKVEPLILAKEFAIDESNPLPSCKNLDLAAARSSHTETAIEDLPGRGFRFRGGFKTRSLFRLNGPNGKRPQVCDEAMVKTLEVPWTLGADFFERHLVDYFA